MICHGDHELCFCIFICTIRRGCDSKSADPKRQFFRRVGFRTKPSAEGAETSKRWGFRTTPTCVSTFIIKAHTEEVSALRHIVNRGVSALDPLCVFISSYPKKGGFRTYSHLRTFSFLHIGGVSAETPFFGRFQVLFPRISGFISKRMVGLPPILEGMDSLTRIQWDSSRRARAELISEGRLSPVQCFRSRS